MIQFNLLLIAFLIVFGVRSLFQVILNRLNIRHLHRYGGKVPTVFQGLVDQDRLTRISSYTADSARFGLINSLFNQSLILALLLSGFLPQVVEWLSLWVSKPIGRGLIFFALLSAMFTLIQIPFNLYDTFVIEERHGFNASTLKTWILDLVKGMFISALIGGTVLALLLILIHKLPQTWWIWAWIVLAIFEGLILWLYPVVIAPWFNKFEPLRAKGLEGRIRQIMEKAGLAVKGVFQMDAGKRTRHTNAYFTGLGKTKRIVLFDTLLNSHTEDEILAILSHEVGHWKKRHVIKQLAVVEIVSLAGLWVMGKLLEWPILYRTFGFGTPIPFVGLFLLGILMSVGGYFFRPLESVISRRFERQADRAVLELTGTTSALGQALKRLALHNLANLTPHPLYAWFYYSHPPIVERIEGLTQTGEYRTRDKTEPAAL
ncbi:MAG: M48 family metalloprotease [Proteobacteria bacterium]|nr:M48 family metalloprotease [Pseudomonadota bacterium]NIS67892.1 M48 family metalloprotease [Pseudomonadota bacterium]